MENLMCITNYQQYKQTMDTEIHKTTEGFVRIGYLLKMARDNTSILESSGYKDVVEFAQTEYHIDKTQVSRFIRINDRFSEGGNSDRLMDKYQEFGYAKLAIMLQLPDGINEILTPDYSKSEIQAIKEEYAEEQKTTELEVMMEGQDAAQANMDNNLAKVLHQLFRENPELFVALHSSKIVSYEDAVDILSPSGLQMYSVRLQGVGRMMLSLKGMEDDVELVTVRTGELEKFTWTETMEIIKKMINTLHEPKSEWESIYGEPFPEKPEVAPVQQEKPAEKPVTRKESKVVKSKPAEKKPEPKLEPETEEQLPGQMDITEFKEALPEPVETETEPEVIAEEDIEVVEEPESRIPTLAEAVQGEEKKKTIAGLKAGITSALNNIPRYMAAGNWVKVGEMLMDAKWRVDKIQELEGK